MEITERDPIPKWDFREPGARLRPWLRDLKFFETWHQHATSQGASVIGSEVRLDCWSNTTSLSIVSGG